MTSKTIALSGAEIRADYSGGTNAWLRNDGTATVYASTAPAVTPGADGTVSIPAGQSVGVYGANGTVYLMGTGSVQLIGSDYSTSPFKASTQSGGSGADSVARAAIEAHAGNADIHVTADEKAEWNGKVDETDFTDHKNDTTAHVTADEKGNWNAKAELSDIPTTLPASGGNSDTLDGFHESSFAQNLGVWSEGDIKDLLLNCAKSGFVFIHPGVTGMPSDNMYWFGLVDCNTVHKQLIVRNVTNNAAYSISWNNEIQTWTAWENIADGGNADTLDGKHAEDFRILTFVDNDADVTCIEARRDNTVIRLQVQTNMEIARLFKSTDGGASWTELPLGAATNVGIYTEAKLAALEARIAALEGGGT